MHKIEITIDETGSLSVIGNVTGPHLIGVLEMAKSAVLKEVMNPKAPSATPDKEVPTTAMRVVDEGDKDGRRE